MPNWVFNTLTIEGNPNSVNKLKEQVSKPFKQPVQANGDLAFSIKEINYSNPVFAFWNVIAPTDMEAYVKQPDFSLDKPYSGDDWYSWNNRNWGSKWDIAVADGDEYPDTQLYSDEANGENHVLVYGYQTAWSPSLTVLENLSSQYPDLLFTLTYQEETGWGGETEILNGNTISESDYNWKCHECDYEELDEPPFCEECEYDMCPRCGWGEPSDECQEHTDLRKTYLNATMKETTKGE